MLITSLGILSPPIITISPPCFILPLYLILPLFDTDVKGSYGVMPCLAKKNYLPQGVPLEMYPTCLMQYPMIYVGLQALLQDLQVLQV